jgi:hypothetical protein
VVILIVFKKGFLVFYELACIMSHAKNLPDLTASSELFINVSKFKYKINTDKINVSGCSQFFDTLK